MDPHFRLVFLFQEKSVSGFVDKFCEHHSRMVQFLKNIEDSAIQLDKMKFGSHISKVAGNSLGAIGGVLAGLGVALAPVTAGLSLALTGVGAGLGITSAANTAVTLVTEITVNNMQQKKANESLQVILQDMKSIQECLDEVTNQREEIDGMNYVDLFTALNTIKTFADEIDGFVQDLVPDVGQELTQEVLTIVLDNLPMLELIGMDIFAIYKNSVSLAKGDKSEVSNVLRNRIKHLDTDFKTWQQMHDSLKQGMIEFERGQSILERSLLYLSRENMEPVQDPMEAKQMSENKCAIQ